MSSGARAAAGAQRARPRAGSRDPARNRPRRDLGARGRGWSRRSRGRRPRAALSSPTARTSPVLEHAQQLRLQVRGQLADLVEEQRAAVGARERAGASRDRAGERAAHVAEQLALEQLARERAAVERRRTAARRALEASWIERAATAPCRCRSRPRSAPWRRSARRARAARTPRASRRTRRSSSPNVRACDGATSRTCQRGCTAIDVLGPRLSTVPSGTAASTTRAPPRNVPFRLSRSRTTIRPSTIEKTACAREMCLSARTSAQSGPVPTSTEPSSATSRPSSGPLTTTSLAGIAGGGPLDAPALGRGGRREPRLFVLCHRHVLPRRACAASAAAAVAHASCLRVSPPGLAVRFAGHTFVCNGSAKNAPGSSPARDRHFSRPDRADRGRPAGHAARDRGRRARTARLCGRAAGQTRRADAGVLYSMGVIARIGQIQRGLGGVQLLLQGEQRATALQYRQSETEGPRGGRHAGRGDDARSTRTIRRSWRSTRRCASARRSWASARPARGGRAPGARLRDRAGPLRGPRRRLHRAAGRRKAGAARDAERRGAAAPRARARPAADRHARGAGGDQVAGPGGARRATARDVPARADQGDPEGARRRRPGEGGQRAAREARQARPAEGGARRGRARAGPARALGPRVDGSAGHPHLSRVDRRAAVEQALGRPARPEPRARRCSTRTTTGCRT